MGVASRAALNDGEMTDHAYPWVDPGARRVLAAVQDLLDRFDFVQCSLNSQLQPLVCRVDLKSSFGFFQLGLCSIQ